MGERDGVTVGSKLVFTVGALEVDETLGLKVGSAVFRAQKKKKTYIRIYQ